MKTEQYKHSSHPVGHTHTHTHTHSYTFLALQITFAPIMPALAYFLSHTPLLKDYDLSSLKSLMNATAHLAPSTMEALKAKVRMR